MAEEKTNKIKSFFKSSSFSGGEILGIVLQIIPFIICLCTFTDKQKILWLIPRDVKISIRPELLSTLFAVIFYGILVIRMGLFKKATITDSIISSIAMFLNVMVFASIFSTIINSDFKFAGIENFGIWILIIGCVLSLLCMRTIAGYVFFIFLIFAIMRLIDINSAMGFCGALYIVFIGISVFLQIPDLKDFSNLLQEFKGTAKSTGSRVVEDMNLAKNDATEKIENIKIKVKTKMDERKNKKEEENSQIEISAENVEN